MSELTQDEAVGQPSKKQMPRGRKKVLLIISFVFIAIAIVWAAMYFIFWQHEEDTDDAYVNGNLIQVTPQVTGTVAEVRVEDTDVVNAGQTVVVLDKADQELAFERAKNQLISIVRGYEQQGASLKQANAEIQLQKSNLAKAQDDLQRRLSLQGTDAISAEEISHAKAAVSNTQAAFGAAQAKASAVMATLGHEALAEKPEVKTAITHLKEAWLNLQRMELKAPEAGQVARRNVQVGQKIAVGSPLMAIVPLSHVWVDANFKEVQIAKMRIGQPVTLTADIYGNKVVYHGKVQGLSAGTGSAFSLLPAQNATGNWIKVVQRVPVRIALDKKDLEQHPLRIGLSMKVMVDTKNQQGKSIGAVAVRSSVEKTAALTPSLNEADAIVADILQQYAPK